MSSYYRTLLTPNTVATIQVDFLTKSGDLSNLLNLTTDVCTSNGDNTITNELTINTSSTNYSVEVYRNSILYQTFNSLSGNSVNIITNTIGDFTYYITGNIGMTFTSQIDFAIFTVIPVFGTVTGFNTTGQTIT